MKTAFHKTAQFPKMKRLAMYFSFIVVLCFFNLVAIQAQNTVSQTSPVNTVQAPIIVQPEQTESKTIQPKEAIQKQQQIIQLLSNVSKVLHDTTMAIIRKIG